LTVFVCVFMVTAGFARFRKCIPSGRAHTTARFGPGYQQGVNANTSASSSGPFQLHSTSTRPDVTLGSVARKWQIENRARQND